MELKDRLLEDRDCEIKKLSNDLSFADEKTSLYEQQLNQYAIDALMIEETNVIGDDGLLH